MNILLKNIRFGYETEPILDGLTLQVKEKEHIGILGSSGSGKSTLLKILAGLYEITDGYCEVAGETVPENIRKKVSIVMQTPGLLPLTIRENITCGHSVCDKQLKNAICASQLEEWIKNLPDGLDTYVGDRGEKVSGGQAQRIAIARAMVKDAPVILLDEPTSALDTETAQALLCSLDSLTQNKTVIHITHQKETIKNYDRILTLHGGQLYDKESDIHLP